MIHIYIFIYILTIFINTQVFIYKNSLLMIATIKKNLHKTYNLLRGEK